MSLKQSLFAIALLVGLSAPADAQGVFDMGVLTNTLSNNAGKGADGQSGGGGLAAGFAAQPAALPADVKKQFLFKFSPEVRQKTYATFVKQMSESHPQQAQAYKDMLAQNDILEMMGQQLTTYGLATNNVSDAFTGYILTLYMMANGRTDENSKEEVASVQKQVDAILANVPALLNASDAEKQNIAENMWMVIFTSVVETEAAKANPQAMAELQSAAKKLFLDQFKMDVSQFNLTPQGFIRKAK
jgi:hypothetical protein